MFKKIKWDYIISLTLLVLLFTISIYFIVNGKVGKISTTEQWIIASILVVIVTLVIVFYFLKRIKIKTKETEPKTKTDVKTKTRRKWNWSWYKFWLIIGAIAVALVIWFEVLPWIGSWGIWKRQHFKSEQSSSVPISDPSSPRAFIFGKENPMKAGVWYTFTQQPDEPLFKFKPATPNTTIIYQIEKDENKTRNWSVEVWTDANNKASENSLNKDGVEPNDASKVGKSRIRVKEDAVVVAYVEKK